MAKVDILNWYAKDESMTRGLRRLFRRRRSVVEGKRSFITMRLGPKWANRLNPGARVAVSISDDPKEPNIIGHACVVSAAKRWLIDVPGHELSRNIGAKSIEQIWKDLELVYGPKRVSTSSVISVIELLPL